MPAALEEANDGEEPSRLGRHRRQNVINKPLDWLSTHHFFRDPSRALYSDSDFFFAPADGIIVYQKQVKPDEQIIDIKGKTYSLRDVMRDEDYQQESIVVGIFMTMYDVHVNRVPYPGALYYKEVEPITSHNSPMLELENDLIEFEAREPREFGFPAPQSARHQSDLRLEPGAQPTTSCKSPTTMSIASHPSSLAKAIPAARTKILDDPIRIAGRIGGPDHR